MTTEATTSPSGEAAAEAHTRIRIEVNGEPREMPEGASVAELLAALGLAAPKVAVERNLEIVPRSAWAATRLAPGDRLEVVHFIGGG